MTHAPRPIDDRIVAFLASADDPAGDPFRTPDRARAWCAARDLDLGRRAPSTQDLTRLRALRRGLRAVVGAPSGTVARGLTALAARARITVVVDEAGARCEPGATGVDGVVGRLLLDAVDATTRGVWSRVRTCRGEGCGRLFLDGTRNGARVWCDMGTCGNRAKVRAHRGRARVGAER